MDRLGLGPAGLVRALAKEIDLDNFQKYRLSEERFPTSLVETYERRCQTLGKNPNSRARNKVRRIGEKVFQSEATIYGGVEGTLRTLKEAGCRLFLWTQGAEAVQHRRIRQSGLRKYFQDQTGHDCIAIDDEKTPGGLRSLLGNWGLPPSKTWLVGNSYRSDIDIALQAGLRAVWIPARTWKDDQTLPEIPSDQVYLINRFSDLRLLFTEQKPTAPAREGEIVYLFVSAYHELYRQYVLDILANPRGFRMRFPYRTQWLPGSYKSQRSASSDGPEDFCNSLKHDSKRALIVFTDERVQGEPRRNPNYLPLRAANITTADLHGEFIQIEFALSDYVYYANPDTDPSGYNQFIQSLTFRPRLNPRHSAYIALGPAYDGRIRTASQPSEDDEAWQSTIKIIGTLRDHAPFSFAGTSFPPIPNPFEHAMFYRLLALRSLRTGQNVPIHSSLGSNRGRPQDSGYRLRSDAQYSLGLLFYSPKRPASHVRRSKLGVTLNPDKALTPIGATKIPLNFSYDIRNFDLATARTFENLSGSISLSIESPSDKEHAKRDQPMAIAPAPILLVEIRANRFGLFLAAIVFLIGSVMATLREPLAKIIVAAFPDQELDADLISVVLGGLGSAITTGVILILYRSVK